MSLPSSAEPPQPSAVRWSSERSAWAGWLAFAATMLVLVGILSVIAGLGALLRNEAYFTANGELLVFNLAAWGWIHIVIGVLLMVAAAGLYNGSTWARAVAVVAVGLNLISQFTWANSAPWWSLIVIAIDVVVIYAIVVHGRELQGADRQYS